jgi:hypothetical protein
MYINRTLLLALAVLVVFYPAVEGWLFSPQPAWYRPYQLWFLLVLATFWNQRTRKHDEL